MDKVSPLLPLYKKKKPKYPGPSCACDTSPQEELQAYDLYCSQPIQGDQDTLASLLDSCHVVHPYTVNSCDTQLMEA